MTAKNNPIAAHSENHDEDFGHPRGTLAVVAIFGALFLLGWLGMYFGMFLQRGAMHR
jgi:hypothetical protein